MTAAEQEKREPSLAVNPGPMQCVRPAVTHSQSDPIPDVDEQPKTEGPKDDILNGETRDLVKDVSLPTRPRVLHTLVSEKRKSRSTIEDSPAQSRSSSPHASLASSATTPSIWTVDSFTDHSAGKQSRTAFNDQPVEGFNQYRCIEAHRPQIPCGVGRFQNRARTT